ncbi:MAG: 5-guanidino-2-oxopentanoate decarboxylase [Pseudomonadota bacterium]
MVTCGVAVTELLARHGVRQVFGIPGNHTLELYRGLDSSSVSHLTTRHEQGAAFAADGYARASGEPGVCYLISGPGLLNAATAIAQARADSVPLLIVTAVAERGDQGQQLGRLHELPDQQAAARGFCSESLTLQRAEDLPALIDYAFYQFRTRRPGPIHIEIPLDLMQAEVDLTYLPAPRANPSSQRLEPARAALAAAAERLRNAQTPLIVLGGGALSVPTQALQRLIERLDAPVINTVNGKGLLPPQHPLAVGSSPSMPCIAQALAAADCVLAIGTEFAETDYDLLMAAPPPVLEHLIRIDIDPVALTRNQTPAIPVCAPAADAVVELLTLLDDPQTPRGGAERAARLRSACQAEPHFHWEFARLFELIEAAAGTHVIVGDSTRPTYYATWQLNRPRPRQYFHSVSGFGTLGYAIPAAIGAARATGAPVLAIIGDGGAQFSLAELATAKDAAAPVTTLIWLNRGYEEIENSLAGRGVSNRSTTISSPDFAQLGAAYGLTVFAPATWEALEQDLATALAEGVPNLLLLRQEDFITEPSGQWYG